MDLYKKIMKTKIDDNKGQTKYSINTSQPINIYFNRIDDAIQLLGYGKTPYTSNQILHMVYHTTLTTGLYADKMKAWRRKPAM